MKRWFIVLAVLCREPWPLLALLPPLAAGILLAGWVGERALLLPAYLEAGDCPQPCWQGFRPGRTTQQEALASARDSPLTAPQSLDALPETDIPDERYLRWETRFFPSYDVQARFRDGLLMRLDLFVDGQVMLGDVFAAFGEPSHALLCPQVSSAYDYRHAVSATLYFHGGAVEVRAYLPESDDWRVRPEMRVQQITYRTAPTDSETWVPLGVAAWHGFGRTLYGGYCR